MNIDQRIQALMESVELLPSFHRDTETAIQQLTKNLDRLGAQTGIMAQWVLIRNQQIKDLEARQ